MQPRLVHAGTAGVLAGLALAGEFAFFAMSGFSPETMNDASAALAFLKERGGYLQIAVVFGAFGVAARMIFISGLAARLAPQTPSRAVATLYFGLIGGIGHGLVALSFYTGFPMLVSLAARDQAAAASAWPGFMAVTSGFQGFGNFLLALMLLAAGWAIIARGTLPVALGWIATVCGAVTIAGVFVTGTAFAPVGALLFMPAMILAMAFDIWGGLSLRRYDAENSRSVALNPEMSTST